VDLAARDSATVGGLVATNAGGIRVLRYGSMRAQLLGAEAVLADGSVVSRMAGLLKDGTGYDLVSLLAGSEGTLGIVTQARLRLVPRLTSRCVALLALPDADSAIAVLPGLRARLPHLAAAELLFAEGLALVRKHGALPAPFAEDHPAYLLLECADTSDPTDDLVEAVSEAEGLLDANVATDAAGQRALWAYREQHTEAINAEGVPVKLDVSVPTRRLPELARRSARPIAAVVPDARPIVFGPRQRGQPARERPRRRRSRRSRDGRGAAPGGRARGLHQLGARGRTRQDRLAAPVALGHRDRRDAGHQARARPAGDAEPRGPAAAV
jgi:FAD/FMN-containing dehydrogenase